MASRQLHTAHTGQSFGQRRPPLSVTIKAILERYPDGQIFKELIQNADDAGARTVIFFVDSRQHRKSSVVKPEIGRFQGPALLAYNDAQFTADDWEGIQYLQQSHKKEDPFKAGKFGIGFNSVYHITDFPSIISGSKLAYLEPQEKIWAGESGRLFSIADIYLLADTFSPFEGICGFTASMGSFSGTLFRFPLRTAPSELSQNVYSILQLRQLLEALKEEAKFLLLFLRSVDNIEVYEKSEYGTSLSFKVSIQERDTVHSNRMVFMDQLKALHATQSYSISNIIQFLADFHVEVKDQSSPHPVLSYWLVTTEVGSTDSEVLRLASKQKTFPWVGTALELKDSPRAAVSPGGRIFCFLPMPVEASSPYPVYINGTFGLNDDRRTLKWPGIERRNDPTAKWNTELVSKLLPSCYYHLVLSARKYLQPENLYCALPDVRAAQGSPWEGLLNLFFHLLFKSAVVCTKQIEASKQKWIKVSDGVFIPQGKQISSDVCKSLSHCNTQLVEIPAMLWNALNYSGVLVKKINPSFTRAKLRSCPNSYTFTTHESKLEILRYCLSDKNYDDLQGLHLLPLADKINFAAFTSRIYSQVLYYLCTPRCPAFLLPNQDGILVDVLDDSDLHSSLIQVARSGETQLKELTATDVAHLLPQSMPQEWRRQHIAGLPHFKFPSDWFEKFWNWVQNESLYLFKGQLIVPVQPAGMSSGSFQVVRLNQSNPVVYIPSAVACSPQLLSALSKLKVICSKQKDFSYLYHKELMSFFNSFNTNGVLDAIYSTSGHYSQVTLTEEEASSMRSFLSSPLPNFDSSGRRLQVLQSLPIFTTMANSSSQLYSVSRAASNSIIRAAIREPDNFVLSTSHIPTNLFIFSNTYPQTQLLYLMESRGLVSTSNNIGFLLNSLLPLIQRGQFPQGLLNGVMEEILEAIPVIYRQAPSGAKKLVSTLSTLPFLKIGSQGKCHCPKDLYDPSNPELHELFKGEPVFPIAPFNKEKSLQQLRQCGLRQSVQPQEIINIINSIALPKRPYPQETNSTRLSRATAVLRYLAKCDSHVLQVYVSIPSKKRLYTFSSALQQLSTSFSWLPVSSTPPDGYPQLHIEWKGKSYNSHFVCICSCTVLTSNQTANYLPMVVGSQVYIVKTQLPNEIVELLCPVSASLVVHVLAHLKLLVQYHTQISNADIDRTMCIIYHFLMVAKQKGFQAQLHQLWNFERWVWLKKYHTFISPVSMALRQNPSFRHNLEPYLFIVPDQLAGYSELFTAYGMPQQITEVQIISVFERIKETNPSVLDPSETWHTVMTVLNWLTHSGQKEVSLPPGSTLYVPIQSQLATPELAEADKVVYTDNDFLKNYLASVETGESYTFVHSNVYPKLAHCLGLSPLSDILDITEDTFEDAGQYEPLTVRLKNILRDYKDGLTIIKELLQNADDAEATEVNICYDARTHNVNAKALLFPGMADSHGPALVVHNDAVFSGEDFDNITKLAGATKESKPLKIGKFGIGFCSVYHITDIPSFVSNDTLCIFDPTLSYLKKEIKNPARPGKKIKFTSKFISASKQLAPYDGLYGFRSGATYNGTMFRFPFRTSASELSGTIYSKAVIDELVIGIQKNASKLLLFLHNVERITFSRLGQDDHTPNMVLEITRSSKKANPSISFHIIESKDLATKKCITQQWLVASSMNTVKNKQATASAACLLEHSLTRLQPKKIEGEVFCFLPLTLKTGLPVHISSNFAVMNNRRGIWTSNRESKTSFEVKWNRELMSTVVPSAYHLLLSTLQIMEERGQLNKYVFYSLWPVEQKLEVHNPWNILVSNLYSQIQSSKLVHSLSTNQWLTVGESKFLDSGILSVSSFNPSTPQCVLKVVKQLQLPIVDLPSDYLPHLNLSNYTITEKTFVKLFFKEIDTLSNISISMRNEVLCCMFEVYATELDGNSERMRYLSAILQTQPCVPCTPDGKVLRQCSSVVDPTAQFASLFDPQESRLPIQGFTNKQLVYTALSNLGMLKKYAPWYLLIERARNISKDYKINKAKALQRVKLILDCVETTSNNDTSKEDGTTLSEIPFLPVLHKPKGYPLPWQGDSHTLHCGNKVVLRRQKWSFYSSDCVNIAGSQVAILNEELPTKGGCGYVSSTTLKILQIRQLPSLTEVIDHLKCLITLFESQRSPHSDKLIQWCDRVCSHAYQFLNSQLTEERTCVLTELQDCSCIWTGKSFISPKDVALQWSVQNGPYLFRIPSELATKKKLIKALDIKENFTKTEILQALQKMRKDYQGKPVKENCEIILRAMIHALDSLVETHEMESLDDVALPDTSFVMHRASDLAFNDAPWYKADGEHVFVNSMITRELALKLGVKPVRSKMLDKYASELHYFQGIEFGQREELTRRIQNILREYPFDVTVLKELLQNADDAKAKRMYVILDKRNHTKKGILSDNWKALQGPALLVWNDSTFSEKDLEGIQKLGLGSKRSESESIGQYGIGFNVVYHLTDCPSFITGGDTLCIFDPHCRYVPGANPLNPGRRFNNLSTGFWHDFPGLKSAYLLDKPSGCPPELLSGSLFRFPLRYTPELVQSSGIVGDTSFHNSKPLTANTMHSNLVKWAPEMKQALLFLNHVTELRFLTIEDKITTEYQFRVHLTESAQRNRELLHEKISKFTQPTGSEPCILRYPLTITEAQLKYAGMKTEHWLIQQGIGDISDNDDPPHWLYIDQVKPRHGIAAPLTIRGDDSFAAHHTSGASIAGSVSCTSREGNTQKFLGKVFCFLPLPIKCNLPVHVNGHFILDASRRALWRATQPGHIDDRTKWNENLLNAIASSYANLLIHAHEYYISKQPTTKDALERSISDYYNIFPQLSDSTSAADTPVEYWLKLAEDVYKKLVHLNAPVLASIKNTHIPELSTSVVASGSRAKCSVEWHKLNCTDEPARQAHFFKASRGEDFEVDPSQLRKILQHLAMNITCAPLKIRKSFKRIKVVIPVTDPQSVFQYYISYCQLSEDPCDIQQTPFETVADFIAFAQYILRKCDTNSLANFGCFEFPQEPFGYPLLLTADCKLQRFRKVIKSNFSSLFPQSKDQFLHADFIKLNLKGSYFISEQESKKDYSIVNNILIKALPQTLRRRRIENASKDMRKSLVMFWKCFKRDCIFKAQLSNILSDWALLLTTDNRVFSCPSKNCLLPVIQPCLEDNTDTCSPLMAPCFEDNVYKPVYLALCHLKMPFLVSKILTGNTKQQFCPMLRDYEWILKNLYYLHKEVDISSFLSEDILRTLMEYFRNINFRLDPSCKKYLFSLPLFQNIDNDIISLAGNAVYVWPDNVSPAGRRKWLQGKRVVFLQYHPESLWCLLGSFEDLGVELIQAETVYVQYIFPEFKKLSEQERYEHLMHIRDNMFGVIEVQAQSQKHKNKFIANEFILALKNLPCIGSDLLQCVSEFCDHRTKVFTTFPQYYKFLPQFFLKEKQQEKKWISFFSKLGLKQLLTKAEYIRCCECTASGKQQNVKQSSSVLLHYLFPLDTSKTPTVLHRDSDFLLQISQIPFVCTEQLPELSWIAPSCSFSECRTVSQTTLNGAADIEHSDLLWQVRPIIKLPPSITTINKYRCVVQKLQVILTPSVKDVIINILRVSNTRFADSNLFNNYPLEYTKPMECKSVMQVLLKNFEFLKSHLHQLTENYFRELSCALCIPVNANVSEAFSDDFVVLVKPQHVILSSSAQDYFPFIHKLPTDMLSVMALLEKIGVSSDLNLKHFQIVLQEIFHLSYVDEMNPNLKTVVIRTIKVLYAILKNRRSALRGISGTEIEEDLSPLYLPTTQGKLHLSSSLLYRDTESYANIKITLSDTELCILHLPQPLYELKEVEFCLLLPKSLRPKMMSECCMQVLPGTGDPVEDSQLTLILRKNLSQPLLLKALNLIIGHVTGDEELLKRSKPVLRQFFEGLIIQPVRKLRPTIILKAVEPPLVVGRAVVNCHIEHTDETSITLSIDSHLAPNQSIIALKHLMQHITSILRPLCSSATESSISLEKLGTPFLTVLTAESSEQFNDALVESGITQGLGSTKIIFEANVKPRLGKLIPKSWHHLLDQNVSNIFHSEEWVGFQEDIEGESGIIFAQVICPILTGRMEMPSAINMKYKIYTKKDDEVGSEVVALQLFKFVSRSKVPSTVNSDEAIATYMRPSDEGGVRREEAREDARETKKKLCQELTVIWKLPDDEKKQGIRRLYLKWHPDKNLNNAPFAEEIFKFLLCQIDKLEKGLPLGDAHSTTLQPEEEPPHSQWWTYYPQWDETAHNHRQSSQSEERYRQQGGRGGRGNRGGGWWESDSANTPSEEEFAQPSPNPQEGKRWVRQARIDYEVLCVVYEGVSSCPEYAGHVCFMAHQVAEKALKGGKYAVCGLGANGLMFHGLTNHAYALQAERPEVLHGLSSLSAPLENYYLNTRYPNRVLPPQIPSDRYTAAEAYQAKCNAESILKMMESIV